MVIDAIKNHMLTKYDPDDLVNVLGITSEELLDAFQHKLTDSVLDGEGLLDDDSEDSDVYL